MNLEIEEFELLRDIIIKFQELYILDKNSLQNNKIEILDKSMYFEHHISSNMISLKIDNNNLPLDGTTFISIVEHQGTYKPLYRVEIDDPLTYFDSSFRDEYSTAVIQYGSNYTFPLLDCNYEDFESTMFQMSTIYSMRDQFILGMDYFIKDHLKYHLYCSININFVLEFSTEYFQEILKEMKKL